MTPDEYTELASRTDPDRTKQVVEKIGTWTPCGSWLVHAHIGLSGEVGEIAAALQRWLYYGKELDKVNVIEEIGDLLWYTGQLCRSLGVSMEEVMEKNIAKLKKRYAEKYTDQEAAEENRDRAAERKVIAGSDMGEHPTFVEISSESQSAEEWTKIAKAQVEKKKEESNIPIVKGTPPSDKIEWHKLDRCSACGMLAGSKHHPKCPTLSKRPYPVQERGSAVSSGYSVVHEQTGQDWAEPVEELLGKCVACGVPGAVHHANCHYGRPAAVGIPESSDNPYTARELKREQVRLSPSYTDVCRLCNSVPVHKTNTLKICGDCMRDLKAELNKEENKNATPVRVEEVV